MQLVDAPLVLALAGLGYTLAIGTHGDRMPIRSHFWQVCSVTALRSFNVSLRQLNGICFAYLRCHAVRENDRVIELSAGLRCSSKTAAFQYRVLVC